MSHSKHETISVIFTHPFPNSSAPIPTGTFLSCKEWLFTRWAKEAQKAKKRHWSSHFKRFKLQHNAKRNLKSDPSYHLLTKTLIKSASDSLRDVFILWMYTHTHFSYTHRQICNHVLEGKNSSKRKKWRKTANGTHPSISTPVSNTSSWLPSLNILHQVSNWSCLSSWQRNSPGEYSCTFALYNRLQTCWDIVLK